MIENFCLIPAIRKGWNFRLSRVALSRFGSHSVLTLFHSFFLYEKQHKFIGFSSVFKQA